MVNTTYSIRNFPALNLGLDNGYAIKEVIASAKSVPISAALKVMKKAGQIFPFVNIYFQESRVNSTGSKLILFMSDAALELKDMAISDSSGIIAIIASMTSIIVIIPENNLSLADSLIITTIPLPENTSLTDD